MKKHTKGQAPKATITQPEYESRPLDDDEEKAIDALQSRHDRVIDAAIMFWRGIYYAPPFMRRLINDALTRAALQIGLPAAPIDYNPITQLEKLIALYKATGLEFNLKPELTAADHFYALVFHDDATQELSDYLTDYLRGKYEAAGFDDITEPPLTDLPAIKIILASEIAAERERGKD